MDDVLQEVVERAHRLQIPALHVGYMDGLTLEVIIRMAGFKKARLLLFPIRPFVLA